jgi:hypothetical protein
LLNYPFNSCIVRFTNTQCTLECSITIYLLQLIHSHCLAKS